jgi:hypothetical protein
MPSRGARGGSRGVARPSRKGSPWSPRGARARSGGGGAGNTGRPQRRRVAIHAARPPPHRQTKAGRHPVAELTRPPQPKRAAHKAASTGRAPPRAAHQGHPAASTPMRAAHRRPQAAQPRRAPLTKAAQAPQTPRAPPTHVPRVASTPKRAAGRAAQAPPRRPVTHQLSRPGRRFRERAATNRLDRRSGRPAPRVGGLHDVRSDRRSLQPSALRSGHPARPAARGAPSTIERPTERRTGADRTFPPPRDCLAVRTWTAPVPAARPASVPPVTSARFAISGARASQPPRFPSHGSKAAAFVVRPWCHGFELTSL